MPPVLKFVLHTNSQVFMTSQGTKQTLAHSQNMSVKGSGRVPKSVHWSVISIAKKSGDVRQHRCCLHYDLFMMSYDVEKLCGYIV